MLAKILELIAAALIGGIMTVIGSWFMLHSKIRILGREVKSLGHDFASCHDQHHDCPDRIKEECQASIKALASVVDELTKTTSLISSTLDAHLRVSQQLDVATEARFSRIEQQLNRIEAKLDQLKGWRLVNG